MKLFLVYHNINVGGPAVVVKNLLKGLSKLNIEIVNDITKADVVGCLQHPGIGYKKLPKETVMGPNIFVLPNEAPEIWNNFTNYIVPCEWVKNVYKSFDTENKRNLNLWAVGVDTDEWSPDLTIKKEYDCFIYYKNRPREELLSIVRVLKTKKQNFRIIQYGQYQENQLKDLCNKSKYAIILDNTESQGLAIQQIMSMDLPCLVYDKTIWEYNGTKYPATSVPYFCYKCGHKETSTNYLYNLDIIDIFNNIADYKDKNKFSPREYIVENFNIELKAKEYLGILASAFGAK